MRNLSLLVIWFPMFFSFIDAVVVIHIFEQGILLKSEFKIVHVFFSSLDLCCHRRQRLYIDVNRNEYVLLTTRAQHRFVPAILAEIESI